MRHRQHRAYAARDRDSTVLRPHETEFEAARDKGSTEPRPHQTLANGAEAASDEAKQSRGRMRQAVVSLSRMLQAAQTRGSTEARPHETQAVFDSLDMWRDKP